ncbi:uncharacterized protein Z518_10090 [Rhinocladiella mackenziei CBS 650.93]|uniref:Rhinocladiella mackenziei CBS 650.93 unplaced genomic scaffold supercont1.8, whole genome shotgun sequence n=1 Tax=Rhinocladiella mackenziei CBS 650.93 TaxID=1442369 RepID=A0A0D2I5I0_9EURO|nr:uncharacterized protein Z518_10090 [Rhinocladiella mackenziei CBS 650.93]KIX01024.1 hypothetical protein Z518_10090 [Rhinocladiella mackenziei CBS 650.93]
MTPPVAVITGACSGIGLALTHHLLSNGWSIVMADIQGSPKGGEIDSERALYIKTNVDPRAIKSSKPGGKIIVKASAAGFYASLAMPQYSATKHGLVRLVRSLSVGVKSAGFTANAVCPGIVATGFPPDSFMRSIRTEWIPPMGRTTQAFDESMGEQKCLNGQTVEVCPEGWCHREALEPLSPSGQSIESSEVGKHWYELYVKRNKTHTRNDA